MGKSSKTINFIKSFTTYQIVYLALVILLVLAFVIFFPHMMVDDEYNTALLLVCAIISTIANPVCELFVAKQSRWNFWVDLLCIEIPDLIIAICCGWYAIAASIVLFWIPIDIMSYIRWNKHLDTEDDNLTEVRKLKPWQSALVFLLTVAAGFAIGYLIQHIPGATDSYLDAISSVTGMMTGILLLHRFNEQWFAWLITSAIYIFMDISAGMYILIITELAMVVNSLYGMVKWYRYASRHNKKDSLRSE